MASTENNISQVISQLRSYKRKYYVNKLVKGGIFFGSILLSVYLLLNSIEYTAHLNSIWRGLFLFSFLLLFLLILFVWIVDPLIKITGNSRQISDEEAAQQIGYYFPEVKDKLLNVLQLRKNSASNNDLLAASINQKTQQISVVSFPLAIDLKYNLRYLKFLLFPALLVLFLLFFIPQLFTEGTRRIVNFNREYVPEAPFKFEMQHANLIAFRNEDFPVTVHLSGSNIPDKVYINAADRRFRMDTDKDNTFQYNFQNIQHNTSFSVDAAGFSTSTYTIKVVDRPNLKNFSVYLDFPSYLNKKDIRLNNSGNLQVPEGTKINWKFSALAADSAWITFLEEKNKESLIKDKDGTFTFSRQVKKSDDYQVDLKNEYSVNKQEIQYHLDVIPDQFPKITLEQFQDTTLYKFLVLGGNISDDYGLTRLALFYKVDPASQEQKENTYHRVNLKLNNHQNNQSYYHQWQVDSFHLKPGDKIQYFLKVWDNDAINGYKSSKTALYTFNVPDQQTIKENISKSSAQTESQISKSVQQANQLQKEINDVQQRLKGKKDLTWQDKQMLEDILKKREEVDKALQNLKEQMESENMKRNQFSEQNEKIKDQVKQLQSLVDELMDDKTKKLYEELKKLLENKADVDKLQQKLSEMDYKEENLEQELERTLELFKKMKFDMKMEDLQKELSNTAEEQEKLAEKTKDKDNSLQDLNKKQEDLNKKFEDFQKEFDDLEKLNQDLKNPSPMQDFSQDQKNIQQEQQDAKESLEKGKRNKAQQSQQNSSQQMQKMSQKMQQMQQSMEMESMQENLDNLRNILDNLITLSFNQEDIMKEFREVKQNDPRFVDLSQDQLKLKDDAQIIEDSLLSLAQRVFQIQSFVTREVKEMNQYMDESMEALRERQQYKAIGKQQYTMTSVNNLALLLNDVLSQMQQQMASAMGNPQNKQGNSRQNMNMSELQKQLNQDIQNLKQSGKSGRELSEELAKLAAQQEKIREALQQASEKEKGGKGGSGDQLSKQMEDTESDLVNKRLTTETIKRQKEILTRLLDVEKSMREQELDKERKGETAKSNYEKQASKSFEEYIKTKKQEIELLKTMPVKLNPYYKNEANEYFKRIN